MDGLPDPDNLPSNLDLGGFSVSLNVADLDRSRAFYEALGFVALMEPEGEHAYLIMKNGLTTIGLFQDVIPTNVLTFNPGLGADMSRPESYTDVREIQRALLDAGLELTTTVTSESGPGHIELVDPDGNAILIDQFF